MRGAVIAAPARPRRFDRPLALLGLAAFAAALLWQFALLVDFGWRIVGYPHEFDYGEGIVWQQMLLLFTPESYGPIDGMPAIVFHYPPVYHAMSAGLSRITGLDGLAAGRLLSLLATLATAAMVAALAARLLRDEAGPRTRRLAAAGGALALLTCWPVLMWAALMRVDMVACAFTLGGLLLAIRAVERRPALIHAAALCFVLAVFSKQVFVAAPAATFLVLLRTRPPLAVQGIASSLLTGLAALGALEWATGGGFLRHILFYNVNRFELSRLSILVAPMVGHLIYVLVGLAGVAATLARVARADRDAADPQTIARLILLIYLAIKTLMLVMIGKVGSSDNYMIEWFCALMVFVGVGLAPLIGRAGPSAGRGSRRQGMAWLLPALLAAQALLLPKQAWDTPLTQDHKAGRDALAAMIAAAGKPVISDDMVIPIRAGKRVVWEPAIFAELAHTGQYDEQAFVARVRAREFAFFITNGTRGASLFDERYNPAVADAIDAAYPVKRTVGGMVVHLPAGGG